MTQIKLTAEDLLVGASTTFEITVPPEILYPGGGNAMKEEEVILEIRPMTIGVFQLIMKAARQEASMIPLLMIKESVVTPKLSLDQIKRMHLGLVEFLVGHIREISGLTEKKNN